jgi:hypothetical protein
VVQHVHEHDRIKRPVAVRDVSPIELLDRDVGVRPQQHVAAAHVHVGSSLHHRAGDQSIASAHVEDPSAVRQELRQMLREDADSPARHVPLMEAVEETHRRRNPSTLRKKLDRIV